MKEPPKEPGWYWRRKWNGPDEWEVKVVHVEQPALEGEAVSALDRIINSGFLDRAWDAADIEAAQTELSTLRARVGELEECLREFAQAGVEYGAPRYLTIQIGREQMEQARRILRGEEHTNPRCPPAEKEKEK